jgi:hypothetical protein
MLRHQHRSWSCTCPVLGQTSRTTTHSLQRHHPPPTNTQIPVLTQKIPHFPPTKPTKPSLARLAKDKRKNPVPRLFTSVHLTVNSFTRARASLSESSFSGVTYRTTAYKDVSLDGTGLGGCARAQGASQPRSAALRSNKPV